MLKDILQNKKCFKLVCGAGNQDIAEIEKLVAIYAKAGANFFDLSAREDAIKAAKKGIERVIPANKLQNYYLCASVGTKDDPHVNKAQIDESKCTFCGKCRDICNYKAISYDDKVSINSIRCLGCGNCKSLCSAISFYSQDKPLENILPPLTKLGINCIELHASGTNENEIYEKWNSVNNYYNGILSISINRTNIGNTKLIEILNQLVKNRDPFTTIIQADGISMSGFDDKYKTTLEAIATAQIINNANLPVFTLLSGGTNSKTAELARFCELNIHGVAIGSFARKIVEEYINQEDFFENEAIFNKAVGIARNLVEKTLKNLE